MASLSSNKNGQQCLQFQGFDKKRKTIRLGKIPKKAAQSIKMKIEQIITARIVGQVIDDETSRWLASIEDSLYEKLVVAGLVSARLNKNRKLAEFLNGYITGRDDLKQSTREHLERSALNLKEYFGEAQQITEITPADAEDFQRYLQRMGLSENTVRRRCGRAKQFFNYAKKKRLIQDNPFEDLKTNVGANREKMFFLDAKHTEAILDACPDIQSKLIFLLARYGGLRCPSEVLSLEWSHILWDKKRIIVPSPKTEHHQGGASRIIPLFNELRSCLEDAFELAEPGTKYIITRYRSKNANLRTQFLRIIQQAGLNPWPKPFQNLRSTRETELMDQFPAHVVCQWIGNSQPIAAKHYLQVTDSHYEEALQNALQQEPEMQRKGSYIVNTEQNKSPELQGLANNYELLRCAKTPRKQLSLYGFTEREFSQVLMGKEDRSSTLCRISVNARTTSELPDCRGIPRQASDQIAHQMRFNLGGLYGSFTRRSMRSAAA